MLLTHSRRVLLQPLSVELSVELWKVSELQTMQKKVKLGNLHFHTQRRARACDYPYQNECDSMQNISTQLSSVSMIFAPVIVNNQTLAHRSGMEDNKQTNPNSSSSQNPSAIPSLFQRLGMKSEMNEAAHDVVASSHELHA